MAEAESFAILDLLQVEIIEPFSRNKRIREQAIADSIARTLNRELVQRFRISLVPEFSIFGLRDTNGHLDACAGVVDAVAIGSSGKTEYVFDWKSTVSPSAQKHAAQLRSYLDQFNIEHGALVYMTTGTVIEVTYPI